MTKALEAVKEADSRRPTRGKPAAQESLRRMEDFKKRKEGFVAAVRKNKN